jgi:hypothetical protein
MTKYDEKEFETQKKLKRIQTQLVIGSWIGAVLGLLITIFLMLGLIAGIQWLWGVVF